MTPKKEEETKDLPQASEKIYTDAEVEIVGKIKSYAADDLSNIVETYNERLDHKVLSLEVVTRRKEIIAELSQLVTNIITDRNKKEKTWTAEQFDAYFETHTKLPVYGFLSQASNAINTTGWGLFMGLLRPMEYGIKIGPRIQPQKKWKW